MIEQLALNFIEGNNQLIKYLEKYGSTLSDEEILEINKKRDREYKELLKTILYLQNNKGSFKN